MDKEKVIKGLEGMIDYFFDIYRNGTDSYKCEKAQEYYDCAIDAIALLKEQEAVEPKSKVRHGANAQIQHFCGNCMTMLHGKPKYCSECGKKVYWHER